MAAVLLSQVSIVLAQESDYTFRLTYETAIPVGKFSKEYISNMSWRGIGFDNRWELDDDYSIGFYLGWQVFYEKRENVTQSNESGNVTVNSDQFRYVNTWPIQLTGHTYFADKDEATRPWVGLAVGTAYSERQTEISVLAFVDKTWSFALTPTAGVDFSIGQYSSFTLGLRYNWSTVASANFDYTYISPFVGFKFIPY